MQQPEGAGDHQLRDAVANGAPVCVIACAVLEDEILAAVAAVSRPVDIEWLEQGLHNEPDELRRRLQALIDRLESERPYLTAIALAYGLCSRALVGLRTRRVTLVVPRAHDCITLLLGSKERYADYVAMHPGTYWYSPGWNRHGHPPGPERMARRRAEYAAQYGEENAEYLMETMEHWVHDYARAAYVHLDASDDAADRAFTSDAARYFGWAYDEVSGDPSLLRDLVGGNWDETRYCVAPPHRPLTMANDERILAVGNES